MIGFAPTAVSVVRPGTTPYGKRSLNKNRRKNELLKITLENQSFLRRLQEKNSNYDVNKWEIQFKERKNILKNICEYPYVMSSNRRRDLSASNLSVEQQNRTSLIPS